MTLFLTHTHTHTLIYTVWCNQLFTYSANSIVAHQLIFFIFIIIISNSETFIYSRFITCKVKYFKSFFVLILMIRAYSSWKSKIQYLKILEYFLRSIKKRICKTEKFKFFKVCSFMHSILGRAPLAQTPASVRCGMEAISLWHCWGTIEPSAHLYCWIDCFSSFSWKYPIDSIWGSCQAYWLANQVQ